MRVGIDISQIIYEGTGVARYVRNITQALIKKDTNNSYVFIAVSFSQRKIFEDFVSSCTALNKNISFVFVPLPIRFMEFIWNRIGIVPIEWFTGKLDVFWSSDWVQPPLNQAIGITTIHDLAIYRYPESFVSHIVTVHKRKLLRSAQICSHFFCDSEATKKDAEQFLSIPSKQITVLYPGFMKGTV